VSTIVLGLRSRNREVGPSQGAIGANCDRLIGAPRRVPRDVGSSTRLGVGREWIVFEASSRGGLGSIHPVVMSIWGVMRG
jgi:hypothetical protein